MDRVPTPVSSGLTKSAFLRVNRPAIEEIIEYVNDTLVATYKNAQKVTPQDFAVLFFCEAGITPHGNVDPNHVHSQGEHGLLPLPSNIAYWNGPNAPDPNAPMPIEENLCHFTLYLGQLKNKSKDRAIARADMSSVIGGVIDFFRRKSPPSLLPSLPDGSLYAPLFQQAGIVDNPERSARLLAGVVHGYFYAPNYSDGNVPYEYLLRSYIADTWLFEMLRDTKYVHAKSTALLTGRARNIREGLIEVP